MKIEKNQRNAIIRVAAYHRLDFEVALIQSTSSDHNSVSSSIIEPFSSPGLVQIGTLECLPTELLRIVCLNLDIRACFSFRQTNRRARELVSGMYEYHALVNHGLESFRAVLRTGVHPHVTLSDLYRALCTRSCEICGAEYGGFLFLPSVTRCCFKCIESSNQLRLVSAAAVAKGAAIPRQKLQGLIPVLHTLPGAYTMQQRSRKSRIKLVSYHQAVGALCRVGHSTEAATSVLSNIDENQIGRFLATTPMPLFDPITDKSQHGISCKGCQIEVEATGGRSKDLYRRRDQIYSQEGYLEHFLQCPQSISLWNKSKEGTVSVDEPEFTRRCGFLAHLRK